jgi:hypothetical protein
MSDHPDSMDYVSSLLDIGREARELELAAQEAAGVPYGHGLHDFVGDIPFGMAEDAARQVTDSDPESWSAIVRASLVMVQGSQSHTELRDRLLHLGAQVSLWLAEVDRRTPVGVEP